MLQELSDEVRMLLKAINNLCWLSRGYLQYHDAFYLTAAEREIMHDQCKERISAQEGMLVPNY